MERESPPSKQKLVASVAADYPDATEVLVSFPEEWELIQKIERGETQLYVAALPAQQERPRPDHFFGLPPKINLQLTTYRVYRLFEPWPMPSILVSWDDAIDQGKVEGQGNLRVHLNMLGQSQAWLSQTVAVIWEAYLNEPARVRYGQNLIYPFWSAVEDDLEVNKIFTQPHEPTWEQDYTEFLSSLGYASDPAYPKWWSKEIEALAGK